MNSDEGKIFVGGISSDTKEDDLQKYFSTYGLIAGVFIARYNTTGRSRGFAYVIFSDPADVGRVLMGRRHIIKNRLVEVKRFLSREEQYPTSTTVNPNQVFVRGLPTTLDEEKLLQYFETFGEVTNVIIVHDRDNHMPRGFGFIQFETEDTVAKVLVKSLHEISGKLVEVKQAFYKNANPGGASGVNVGGAFDSRLNYVQPQTTAVPYSGYSSPSYRYGSAYGGNGLGGYGNAGDEPCGNVSTSNTLYANRPTQSPRYGASGYGGAAMSGLTGQSPSRASGYGTPNMSNILYANKPNQSPSYGASGCVGSASTPVYGSSGYGDAVRSRFIGQSPSRASGYGNPNTSNILYANRPNQSSSYGASGYAGFASSTPVYGASGYGRAAMSGLIDQSPSRAIGYGNPNTSNTLYANRPNQNPSYGASGYGGAAMSTSMGETSSSHMRSGYGEFNRNSGYQGGSWQSDTPQSDGGGDYGSGYGDGQPRQNKQW